MSLSVRIRNRSQHLSHPVATLRIRTDLLEYAMFHLSLQPTTVYATSTSEIELPATPWFAGSGLVKVRASFELRQPMAPIEVGIGIQSANAMNEQPSSATVVSRKTSAGMHFASSWTDVESTASAGQMTRFVWLTARTTGTAPVMARVTGRIELEGRPDLLRPTNNMWDYVPTGIEWHFQGRS